MMDDEEAHSAVDAATTDLAILINRLNLCATTDASLRARTPANAASFTIASSLMNAPPFINMFDSLPLPVHMRFPASVKTAPTKFDDFSVSPLGSPFVESPATTATDSPAVETPISPSDSIRKPRGRKSLFNMPSISSLRVLAQSIGRARGVVA